MCASGTSTKAQGAAGLAESRMTRGCCRFAPTTTGNSTGSASACSGGGITLTPSPPITGGGTVNRPWTIRDQRSLDRLIAHLRGLNLDKAWSVEIGRPKRSRDQNSLYWMWMGVIATETGNSPNDIHEWCKAEFLPPRIVEIDGVAHEWRPSTTALKINEMSAYMTQVQSWAAQYHGIALPIPEELHQGRAP